MSAPSASTPSAGPARAAFPVLLVGVSAVAAMLTLFQWMELLVVRAGGASVCAINDTVSCERVWNSSFATQVHALTRLPIAGWGLVWALTALSLSLLLVHRRLAARPEEAIAAALKWTAAAGVFASLTFAAASARAGGVCLTCAATYVLAFLLAWAVLRAFPDPLVPRAAAARDGLLWAAGLTLAGFLLLLYPGLHTPHAGELTFIGNDAGRSSSGTRPAPSQVLQDMVSRLTPGERQLLSDAVHDYQSRAAQPVRYETRMRAGADGAPVRLVEFTDILCPHCRHFGEAVMQLRQALPANALSVEPRQYPLDKDCNPYLKHSDEKGVRCLAAKALICLEGTPEEYWRVAEALFSQQDTLTAEHVMQIAGGARIEGGAASLRACIDREETTAKLREDVEYAQQFGIRGTPLVLVNGREAFPSPMFLYALALAGGNPEAILAMDLPPPRREETP